MLTKIGRFEVGALKKIPKKRKDADGKSLKKTTMYSLNRTTDESSRENKSAEQNHFEQLWLDIQAPV